MESAPINAALLSFGMSGWVFHAPFLDINPHFRFYGVWERSKNNAAEKYPDVKTFRTLDSLLDDPAIELVVVNTPNSTHYAYAKAALEKGKHVIVEKPFTVTAAEGEELIRIAADRRRLLSVYQNRRFDSDYKAVKKVLDAGLLGELVEAEFHFDRYKQDLSPKLHKEIPGEGTGALYDLGSHLVDQALQLFGQPEAIFADIRIIRPQSQVDDYFELLLYYRHFRVRLRSSYLVREPLPAYILHGSKGSFIKSKTDVQETDLQAGKTPGTKDWGREPEGEQGLLHTERSGTVIREHLSSEAGNYGAYYDGICDALRKNGALPVTPSEALLVVRVIEAAFKSSAERRVVSL